jgi:hypothetical protein
MIPDTGCRMPDNRCQILDAGCWILDDGYRMPDVPKNQKSSISLFFVDPRSREPGIGTGYQMPDAGYRMSER